jgi:Lipase (class 3)
MTRPSTPTTITRTLGTVLEDVERDLDNAEWNGLLGLVLHSIRDSVWIPSIRLVKHWTPILPQPVDQAAALLADTTCHILKFTYSILPHMPCMSELAVQEIHKNSIQTLKTQPQSLGSSDNLALLLGGIGMLTNFFLDLVTNSFQKFRSFFETMEMFFAYLIHSGIDQELARAFWNPYTGISMLLTVKTQASLCDKRLKDASFQKDPVNGEEKSKLIKESKRYLQFAIASYGIWQIAASDSVSAPLTTSLVVIDQSLIQLHQIMSNIFQGLRKRRLAKYLGIPEDHILLLTPPGGDVMIVRHMVAIDHVTQSIVLAIRGTFSASDFFTDINARTGKYYDKKMFYNVILSFLSMTLKRIVEFCGGLAHRGMATLAINLIHNDPTAVAINHGFKKYPGYKLVITGHSLGAGVASLALIHLHYHNCSWINKGVRCIGFGCPPVFGAPVSSPSMKALVEFQRLKKSMSNTVCFINNQDVVPFLSIDSIRRLANTLEQVKNIVENWSPIDRILNVREPNRIPELRSIVEDGSTELEQISGAERLKIPGRFVAWIDSKSSSSFTRDIDAVAIDSSNVVLCKPSKLSNLAIRLSNEFILDHLPPRYEESFATLVKEN